MTTTIAAVCEHCEQAEATDTVAYLGSQRNTRKVCDDCLELLMLDGEWER